MITDMFSYTFMQYAIIAAIIISVICSLFGVFVVQRKMSFLGSGLAHSALGGVGLALLLGIEPLYITLPFTIIIGIIITLINQRTKIEIDTSIGIMFSLATALGIIFISQTNGYVGDVNSYLFGSILGVSTTDIILSIIAVIISVIYLYINWNKLSYLTFDKELAKSDKINIERQEIVLSIFLSTAIVISLKIIGIVLVGAFLVLPAATGRIFAKTFCQMAIISVIFGISTTFLGITLSYIIDLPSGATIIILQAITFGISVCIDKLK